MAKEVGFLHCLSCDSVETVLECGGQKVGTYYTSCLCGKKQGGGIVRQEFIKKNMVLSMAEYKNSDKNTLNTENNASEVPDIETALRETVIQIENNEIETVSGTIVDDEGNPNNGISKGFFAMCCGLAAAAGLLIGHSVGVKRG